MPRARGPHSGFGLGRMNPLTSPLRLQAERLVDGHPGVMERRQALDDVGSLFGHHDGGCVQVAADDARHDRGVHHPERVQTIDACLGVHHGHVVRDGAHLAGAGRVVRAVRLLAHKGVNLGVRGDPRARLDLGASEGFEGLLGEDLP